MNMKDLVLVKMDMLHYVHDMRAVKGVGLSLQKRKRLNINLFIIKEPIPFNAKLARINTKERKARRGKKRKGIEAYSVKYLTPSQAVDVHTGDEEQNGKQKRTKRKKQGVGPQPSYPGPFSLLLRRSGVIW